MPRTNPSCLRVHMSADFYIPQNPSRARLTGESPSITSFPAERLPSPLARSVVVQLQLDVYRNKPGAESGKRISTVQSFPKAAGEEDRSAILTDASRNLFLEESTEVVVTLGLFARTEVPSQSDCPKSTASSWSRCDQDNMDRRGRTRDFVLLWLNKDPAAKINSQTSDKP